MRRINVDFYRIDEKYCKFLQEYEKEKRGLTKVPNIRYTDRNKFAFGAVMQIHNINYYVSVSSFDKKQEANILIRVPGDKKEIKGSLRFNYMICLLYTSYDNYTFVEVPREHADVVLQAMRGAKIKGKNVHMEKANRK